MSLSPVALTSDTQLPGADPARSALSAEDALAGRPVLGILQGLPAQNAGHVARGRWAAVPRHPRTLLNCPRSSPTMTIGEGRQPNG